MHEYGALMIFIGIIMFLVGLGFGIIAGYYILKSDFEDHHDYLEYLIHRQDEIRNYNSIMKSGEVK